MWCLKANRKEFLEVLGNEYTAKKIVRVKTTNEICRKRLTKGSILIVWEFEPKTTPPCLVITPDNELRDFLAWVTTYLPSFKPFTAFFKTINLSLFKIYVSYVNTPNFNKFEDVCAGMIITEALTQIPIDTSPDVITPTACKSTASYCYTQAISCGISIDGIEEIVRRWKKVRAITVQPKRNLPVSEIGLIGTTLESLILERPITNKRKEIKDYIYQACKQIHETGKCKDNVWREIVLGNDKLIVIPERIKGNIEDRIQLFDKAIHYLKSANNISNHQSSFVCGYFASLIKPGSLEHFNIIKSQLSYFPSALIWYGFLTGLNKKNMVLSIFDNLGRRLLRDLKHDKKLISSPSSDISFDELNLRISSGESKYNFKKNYSNSLQVELVPNIVTIIRILEKEQSKEEHRKIVSDQFSKKIDEMGSSINRLNNLYDDLKREVQFDKKIDKTKKYATKKEYKQQKLI